jgi:hypothetical protein
MAHLPHSHLFHVLLICLGGIALLYIIIGVSLLIEYFRTPKDPPNIYGA